MSTLPIPQPLPASLQELLSALVDYAGLFPPAALDLKTVVSNYGRYLAGTDAWMLGRLVLPAVRLGGLETLIANKGATEPWIVSALLGSETSAELEQIADFNSRNKGRAIVDTVEAKADSPEAIRGVAAEVPKSMTCYFEIPPHEPRRLLEIIGGANARAKIRTGSMTPEALPSSDTVAEFIATCAEVGVAFKATAGLHHPVRCLKPLTYESDGPTGTMHGFLNVFLAAVFAQRGMSRHDLAELLDETHPTQFQFEETGAYWRDRAVNTQQIRSTRERFAISFGSCSFEEPIEDLRELELL